MLFLGLGTGLGSAMIVDGVSDVVGGGGNAKLLGTLPSGIRVGRHANAFVGGYRLWKAHVRN